MKKFVKAVIAGALGAAPLLAFAAAQTINDIINILSGIVQTLVPFVIGLAVLIILWGVFNYIAGAGDEEKRAEAKKYIIWGIIGLFVMVSLWGLVGVLDKTLNLDKASFPAPQVIPCPPGKTATVNQVTGAVTCT